MSRRKRPRDEGPKTPIGDLLKELRECVDIDKMVQILNDEGSEGVLPGLLEKAANECCNEGKAVNSEAMEAIMNRACKAKRGKKDTRETPRNLPAPLSEVVWLLKHHGVERTAASRTEGRSGLQQETPSWIAFSKYYKNQKILKGGDVEWDTFESSLRTPLPMTLRLTPSRPYTPHVQYELKELIKETPELSPLKWCSHAWQDDTIRAVTAPHSIYHGKTEHNKKMQDWCKEQNYLGTGQFQEAVSMIPPVLLDPEPHHLVLDMCSAPGSKLLQAADIMLEKSEKRNVPLLGGIIGNEIDKKKASQVIPARIKRVHAKNIVVTSGDARLFPSMHTAIKGEPVPGADPKAPRPVTFERILFDRIIADVPCSGDGTGRKDKSIWETWSPQYALSLHPKQLAILMKGLDNLKPGGRLVYSTCSLNPLENEAVVAAALAQRKGFIELESPPGEDTLFGGNLKWDEGLSQWGVPDSTGELVFEKPEGEQWEKDSKTNSWESTMFVPSDSEITGSLKKCIRVHPHANDSGGFFIAAFIRVKEDPQIAEDLKYVASSKKLALDKAPKEGQKELTDWEQKRCVLAGMFGARLYYEVTSDLDATWKEVSSWYGIADDGLTQRTVLAQLDEHDKSKKRKLFVTTPGTVKLLQGLIPCTMSNKVKVHAVGTRLVTTMKYKALEGNCPVTYRPAYEGAEDLAAISSSERKLFFPVSVAMSLLENKSVYWKGTQKKDVLGFENDNHWIGPCLVGLDPKETASRSEHGDWSRIFLPSVLLKSKIELTVEDHERTGLLALLKKNFPEAS